MVLLLLTPELFQLAIGGYKSLRFVPWLFGCCLGDIDELFGITICMNNNINMCNICTLVR